MNAPRHDGARTTYRTIFISDTHLGTRGCRSDFLADFLRRNSCQSLFLVGDIIDGWRLRKSWYWDASHDDVLRLMLRHARDGTEVTYIPGNHDEMFRAWLPLGLEVAGIKLRKDAEHVTADGRRLLIMHGDEFDSVVRYAKFLALLGDWAYTAALGRQHLVQRGAAAARLPLLVAVGLAEASGEGGGQGDRPVRGCVCPTRQSVAAASTVWCAGTSIMRRCARSAACYTATMGTGSKAAPHSSSTMMGGSN